MSKHSSSSSSSLRRARIAAAVVILSSIVYNAPQFAEREAYEESVRCPDGDVMTRWRTKKTHVFDSTYYSVYKTICYIAFRSAGPLLILLVLNARLVLALNRIGRRRRRLERPSAVPEDDVATSTAAAASVLATTAAVPLTDRRVDQRPSAAAAVQRRRRRNQQRENITLMLVVVVFVFIVCQLPDSSLRIVASLVVFALCRLLASFRRLSLRPVTSLGFLVSIHHLASRVITPSSPCHSWFKRLPVP